MSRIELPDGEWAEIRDPKKVPERLRRPAKAASYEIYQSSRKALEGTASTATPEAPPSDAWGAPPVVEMPSAEETALTIDLDQIEASVDAGIVALVSSWSFGDTVSLDALLDLPGDAYDALQAAITPLIGEMFQSLEPSTDPETPSVPLSA